MGVASLVTTCRRPYALRRSLPQIVALGDPVLVVDDSGTDWGTNLEISVGFGATYLRLPENRGLAGAMNIGLAYILSDTKVEWVSYFQDDVDVRGDAHRILAEVREKNERPILTGRDAREHASHRSGTLLGHQATFKKSSPGQHLYAHRDYWCSVMPIPTRELGAPKKIPGAARGLGSNVDWWIVTRAPNSVGAMGREIICIPGLVRTFLVRKGESTWDNEQAAGEDPPFVKASPQASEGS